MQHKLYLLELDIYIDIAKRFKKNLKFPSYNYWSMISHLKRSATSNYSV